MKDSYLNLLKETVNPLKKVRVEQDPSARIHQLKNAIAIYKNALSNCDKSDDSAWCKKHASGIIKKAQAELNKLQGS